MKQWLKNVSFMILLLKSCILLCQNLDTKKIVVIDPGHGGKDSGAIGINGIQEKDVALNIANAILKLNDELDKTLDIYLTRHTDTLISISDRTKLAKVLKADLFVSLHCNHSDNSGARGIEIYVAGATSKYSDDVTWLAFQLQAALNKQLGYKSRGVKFANFQVLRETVNHCPSLLLELGFLSNWDENRYLSNSNRIKIIAYLIYESIKYKR